MTTFVTGPRLVVALDFSSANAAEALAACLEPATCRLKVGKELFTRAGPALVERLQARGFEVFLDLKYHDIPNTVAGACRAAAELGVWMVNVHALGGRAMLEAAREAVERGGGSTRPLLTSVTVLTSHDAASLEEIGVAGPPEEAVLRLARLARESDLDGVVCSPEEAAVIGEHHGQHLLRVTPGIRLATAAADDQRRIATPAAAVAAGCDQLVVGRPITAAEDPAAAAAAITAEIEVASS